MAISTNLSSYWPLNEASGTRADSVVASANNLTDSGSTGSTTGIQGNAANFAGSTSLSHSDGTSLATNGASGFTVTAWVKTTLSDLAFLVTKDDGSSRQFALYHNSGTPTFEVFDSVSGTSTATNGSVLINDGNWHFLVAWYNPNDKIARLSIDGTNLCSGSALTNGISTASVSLVLGGRADGFKPHTGALDEVGFWKRILTASEVTWLRNAGSGRTYSDITTGMKYFTQDIDFFEGNEGAGGRNYDWVTTSPDSNIAGDATAKKNGNFGILVDWNGATAGGEASFISWDSGTERTSVSVGFWFNGGDIGTDTYNYIFGFNRNTTALESTGMAIGWQRVSGQHQLFLYSDVGSAPAINVSAGAWYWVTAKYVKNGTSTLRVYDASQAQVGQVTVIADNVVMDTFNVGIGIARDININTFYDDIVMDYTDATFPLLGWSPIVVSGTDGLILIGPSGYA